jgi:hypothetical protein
MEIYRDVDGDSGVHAYEISTDFIRVQFSIGFSFLPELFTCTLTAAPACKTSNA